MVSKEKDLRNAAERYVRETRRDIDRRIDEIRAELKAKGPEAVEKAEKSLNDLKEDLQNRLQAGLQSGFDDIQGKFEDEVEAGRKEVREHPFLAVGVAIAAGLILGMLLGNRKD
jgi:ElaB/YqjD/DUF883 family membrane-anchored ribosome-binding protein